MEAAKLMEDYAQEILRLRRMNSILLRQRNKLMAALTDSERIISTAIREKQLKTETEAQKQNEFDARGHIGAFRKILAS